MYGNNQVITDHNRIDQLEAVIVENLPQADCPIFHYYAKGMYIREMVAKAGTLIVSKIHKTEHPYTISKGKLLVRVSDNDWIELSAPYTGITKPGTRRVAYVIQDCVWTTYHRSNSIKGNENELTEAQQNKIIDRIEAKIIEKHDNILLKEVKEKQLWHG